MLTMRYRLAHECASIDIQMYALPARLVATPFTVTAAGCLTYIPLLSDAVDVNNVVSLTDCNFSGVGRESQRCHLIAFLTKLEWEENY